MEQKSFNYYGFGYRTVNETEVLLIDGALARGKVIIPSEVEDPDGNKYTVVGLGKKTMTFSELIQPDDRRKKPFYKKSTYSDQKPFTTVQNGQKVWNKDITELILPNTIRGLVSLGADLQSFSIPYGVTEIPSFFHNLGSSLKNIIIPDSVTIIGESAFQQTGLLSIKFPSQLEEIPTGCCLLCKELTEVILPYKLKKIDKNAFACCAFKTVDIPSSVTHIDDGAFYGKNTIKSYYYVEEKLETVNIFNDEGAVIIHPNAFGPNVQINYLGVKKSTQTTVKKNDKPDKEVIETKPQIDLDKLIAAAVFDGVITDKERSILLKKASAAGYDADEVELLLDSKLYEVQQMAAPAPKTTESVALDPVEAKKGKDKTSLQKILEVNSGDFTLVKYSDNSYSVSLNGALYGNIKDAMRQMADAAGFEYDPKWTTQQFGSKLMKFLK